MAEKIKKVTIGVTTYGTTPRIAGFLKSLWSNLDAGPDVTVVCCDDGTPHLQAVREREEFCQRWNTVFLHNSENIGIPGSWNRLAAHDPEAELVVIFNDDIRLLAPGWLTRLLRFYELNENIGTVGLPLVDTPSFDDADPRWWNPPGRCGAAVGCAFAVRPRDIFSITNRDNSSGWWTDLKAFHEEIHAGFKLSEKGLLSYMLPFPCVYHQGGATFQASPELIWREPSKDLPMEEFLFWAEQSKWFVPQYRDEYSKGRYDRMTASRILFCKEWGLLDEIKAGNRLQEIKGELVDILEEPTKPVHSRTVDIWPARTIRWLTRDGEEKECQDA